MRRWIVLGFVLAVLGVGLFDQHEPSVVADARATLSPDEETAQVPTLTAVAMVTQTAQVQAPTLTALAAQVEPSQTIQIQLTATLTPTCAPGPQCVYLPKIEGPPSPPTAIPPTAAPTGVYVDSDAGWTIGNDALIAGEVINATSEQVCDVRVTVRLFNADGSLAALKDGDTILSATTAYQHNPFAIRIYDIGTSWDSYTTTLSQGRCFSDYRPVTVTSTADRDVSGGVEVFGDVTNQNGAPMRNVQVAITYFDPDGDVITAGWDLLTPSNLAAGASGTYSSPVYISNIRQLLGHYTVQAQGYVSSSPLAADERTAPATSIDTETWERHR